MAESKVLEQALDRLRAARALSGIGDPSEVVALTDAVDLILQHLVPLQAQRELAGMRGQFQSFDLDLETTRRGKTDNTAPADANAAAAPAVVHTELRLAPGQRFELRSSSALGDVVFNRAPFAVYLNIAERYVRAEEPKAAPKAGDVSDLDLDALQKLCDAATPGKWVADLTREWVESEHDSIAEVTSDLGVADVTFIAAARDALPKLIAKVRELQSRVDEADYLDRVTDPRGPGILVGGDRG